MKNYSIVSVKGQQFQNDKNYPPEIVEWLTSVYEARPVKWGSISTTQLIQHPRKYILKHNNPNYPINISTLLDTTLGTVVHSSLPTKAIYSTKEFHGWTITGEIDYVTDTGIITDYKVVSPFTAELMDRNDEQMYKKYQLQLSIYSWLNPSLNKRVGRIIHIVKTGSHGIDRVKEYPIQLIDVEPFISERLQMLDNYKLTNELPECPAEDKGTTTPEYKLVRPNKQGVYKTVRGSKHTNLEQFNHYCNLKMKSTDQKVFTEGINRWCLSCQFNHLCN